MPDPTTATAPAATRPHLTPAAMVGIVHDAIITAEHRPCRIELEWENGRTVRRIDVQLWGSPIATRVDAFSVLAWLGDGNMEFKPFESDPRYGYMVGFCDRVGVDVRVFAAAEDNPPC